MGDIEAPEVPQLVTRPNVDLVAAGTWQLSTGEATFTADDLQAAIEAQQCPAIGQPVIKLGHVDPRFDGEPAVGYITNMALAASGSKIVGDLTGIPAWLDAVLASAYPNRSIEGYQNFVCSVGHSHPFVITGLALLGVTPPGVGVLSSLKDVAALYGVAAAVDRTHGQGDAWRLSLPDQSGKLESGGAMPEPVMAGGATVEDVRRAFYEADGTPMTYWITAMQLDPPQLIVSDDASGSLYRVPVTISGSDVSFGEPVQVQVEYQDVPAKEEGGKKAASVAAARFPRPVAAAWDVGAEVKKMGTDPSASAIKAMFAIPGDTKSDSKLPHHDVSSDGKVGAADMDGVEAALAALNGSLGGLKDVSDEQGQEAYDHLAAHYKAAGKTPPPLKAAATHDPHSTADLQCGGQAGEPQGTPGGNANHDQHGAATVSASMNPTTARKATKEAAGMFSDEELARLRAALGKGEADELTGAEVLVALRDRDQKVAAAARADQGTVRVDASQWEAMQEAAKAGQEARAEQKRQHRDSVIKDAIAAGKFAPSRRQHWEELWDADPQGAEETIAQLKVGTIPLKDIGEAGGEVAASADGVEDWARALFPEWSASGN